MGIRGRAAALAALAVVLAGCGGDSKARRPGEARVSVPLRRLGAARRARTMAARTAPTRSPSATSPTPCPGGRVEAYLAVPKVKGRVPAVIYLHGAGEGRERFVLPATWAAGRRAVGMTLTLPSSTRRAGERALAAGGAGAPAADLRRRRRRRAARDRPPSRPAATSTRTASAWSAGASAPAWARSPPASTRG